MNILTNIPAAELVRRLDDAGLRLTWDLQRRAIMMSRRAKRHRISKIIDRAVPDFADLVKIGGTE